MPESREEMLQSIQKIIKEMAAMVCEKLEQVYSRKFIASRIEDDPVHMAERLYVHPEDDESMQFIAAIDRDKNITEDYVTHLVLREFETAMVQALNHERISGAAKAVITGERIVETNADITLQKFLEKHCVDDIFVRVILEEGNPELTGTIHALEKVSADFHIDVIAQCFVLDRDAFEQCRSAFLAYPSSSTTEIEAYSPKLVFSSAVRAGKSSLTVEQLGKMLEVK